MITEKDIERIKGSILFITKDREYKDVNEAINVITPILEDYIGFVSTMNSSSELNMIDEDDKNNILNSIIDSVSYKLDECDCIAEEKALKDDWLEKLDISFPYLDRYLEYLKNKGWENTEVFKKDSFKIIQMLGDPNVEGQLHRKGMLIGDVQSGKTASYTAILNRAVDVGYDIIILLTGVTENLRFQTQKRIENDLIGVSSREDLDNKDRIVGVGEIETLSKVLRATSLKNDYSKKVAETQAVTIIKGQAIIFVAKKNVSTLSSIKSALKKCNESISVNGIINGSILILDDESDNASVDTSKKENDPTAINREIREIINSFARTAYLAVTATPFANIFIDDDLKEDTKYKRDLFPSDFICLLDRPVQYLGADKLFGDVHIMGKERWTATDETYASHCIREIKEEQSLPYVFGHKKDVVVEDGEFENLPTLMKRAIRYFILVQKLMDNIRTLSNPHRTMMINVSRFVDVQNDLYKVLKIWLEERLKPQVKKYGFMPDKASDKYTGEYYELKKVWDEEHLEYLSGIEWKDYSPELAGSIGNLRIAVENNSHKKDENCRLDYEKYSNGERVIVVGGQCLSRGLTLEGLVVSYFYRNSSMYDTLLQMGRWFGYRNSYLKYFRIWLSEKSNAWYRYISDASEDLRAQIRRMNDLKMTPSQFGLAVRFHPATNLIVTARNKMRRAKVSDRRVPVDIGGHVIESSRLLVDERANECNAILIQELIEKMNGNFTKGPGGVFWKGIDRDNIASFVENFQSSKLSIGFKVEDLATYVRTNSTEKWSVGVAQYINTEAESIDGIPILSGLKKIKRPYEIEPGESHMKIYGHHVKIGSGDVAKLGFTFDEYERVKKAPRGEKEKNTDSFYLRNPLGIKRESILILYPMELYDDSPSVRIEGKKYYEEPCVRYGHGEIVWGIGLGFACDKPAESEADCYSYMLNPVAIDLAWGFVDEEGGNDE